MHFSNQMHFVCLFSLLIKKYSYTDLKSPIKI